MGSIQYPVFDPTKQTYLDYVNQQTGYAPQNTFPAETNQPFDNPYSQIPEQQGPQPQQGPAQQATQLGTQAYGTYQAGKNISSLMTSPAPASDGGAVASSVAPSEQMLQASSSGYPATEAAIHGIPATPSPMMTPLNSSIATPMAGSAGGSGYLGLTGAPSYASLSYPAGAYTGYQQLKGVGDVAENKPMSLQEQAALALPTFGLSLAYNPVRKYFGSTKGKDQLARDEVRGEAQKSGWLDSNFQAPINDNLTLDLGKDGGFQYTNKAGESRPVYNVDTSDPNSAQAVGWIQPLAAVLAKGDEKLTSDFTAELLNEITKDGTDSLDEIRKRVVQTYNHFQLKPSIVASAVTAMKLDPNRKDAYLAAIENLKPGRKPQDLSAPKNLSDALVAGKPRDNLKAMGAGGLNATK